MQILAVRKTGDGSPQEIYVQQITVSGLNDATLSDGCDGVIDQLRSLGLNVQFRDDNILEEVRARIFEALLT